MEPFHVAHLVVLGMWLGVVITEVLFEFAASDAESLRAAARFHYNVDKFGELPILFAVLVTGTILAVRAWPLTPLHFIKIAASLIAVGCRPDLHAVGVPAAANRGRERAAGIPAAYLDPGGGRRGLRDPRSLSRAGLFPGVVASASRHPARRICADLAFVPPR